LTVEEKMTQDRRNTLTLKPIWNNGRCTYEVKYPDGSTAEQSEIDRFADEAGYLRDGDVWTPPRDAKSMQEFHRQVREAGYGLFFDEDRDARPFNLQRLLLEEGTRHKLETLQDFELYHLYGWTPVQAEGELNGCYWYFRARGSSWRVQLGGNEMFTRSPRWWYEEPWPSKTGFEAGYMSDQQAVSCILKAVGKFRYGDNSHFQPDHPDYERMVLDGWSLGAISMRIAAIRLGITGEEVLDRTKEYGIEVPWTAERELEHLKKSRVPYRRLRPKS